MSVNIVVQTTRILVLPVIVVPIGIIRIHKSITGSQLKFLRDHEISSLKVETLSVFLAKSGLRIRIDASILIAAFKRKILVLESQIRR